MFKWALKSLVASSNHLREKNFEKDIQAKRQGTGIPPLER